MKPSAVLRIVLLLAACAVLFVSPALAGFAGTETYLAAIGNPQGAGGAQFLSDVWVTDVSASPVTFTFQFLQAGQANLSPASFSDTLSPGQTKRYSDVVGTQLHLTNVNGAARILSNGEIFVSERIYNRPAGVPLSQTAGQFFSGIPKGFSIGLGQSATLQGVYLGSGLDFRYNYVLLETSGSACTVHVQALDGSGSPLGAADFSLLAYEHLLLSAGALAPAASTTNARLVATVTAGSGTALFAGSQVGNGAPQDQSGFEMSFRDALLGSAGVTSLNGLTGAVTLTAGSNVTLGGSGNNIVINASGGGGGGSVSAPLTLSNGPTSVTIAGPRVAIAASTTDSANPPVPAISGSGVGVGVYGQVAAGGHSIAWGELGSADTLIYFGAVGSTVSIEQGTAGVYGVEGGGSGGELLFPTGIWGDSAHGVGVYGTSSHASSGGDNFNYGVYGTGAVGVSGNGVLAAGSPTTFSYGVQGLAYTAGDVRAGVYGFASGTNLSYAGRFDGSIEINGTVHASDTVVRFDHPLDPENKYLYHSVVESPDRMNIYNGIARLDARGEAVVALPDWFQSLNEEFRYQLTPVGAPGRDLYIAEEVQNNRFRIAGGTPGLKVSWQVTGIRHDAYSARNPMSVEAEKPEGERGLYLHPEAFGQPIDKGVTFKTLSAILPESELKKIREQSEKATDK